jgi:hypothetical protein
MHFKKKTIEQLKNRRGNHRVNKETIEQSYYEYIFLKICFIKLGNSMKIVTRCHSMLYRDDIVHRDYLFSL